MNILKVFGTCLLRLGFLRAVANNALIRTYRIPTWTQRNRRIQCTKNMCQYYKYVRWLQDKYTQTDWYTTNSLSYMMPCERLMRMCGWYWSVTLAYISCELLHCNPRAFAAAKSTLLKPVPAFIQGDGPTSQFRSISICGKIKRPDNPTCKLLPTSHMGWERQERDMRWWKVHTSMYRTRRWRKFQR